MSEPTTQPTTQPPPAGRTARRLEWAFLPPAVRALVERRCGSPVTHAASQGSGFTPGFASVLTCQDGSRHFVKAASVRAQRMIADSYREEALTLTRLPRGLPAPRLLWSHDDGDWVVLGIEYAAGRPPARPWRTDQLDRVLDVLQRLAAELTPVPPGLDLATAADELGDFVAMWDAVRAARDLPHADEAAALAARFPEVAGGHTLVHTDIRDDNLLLETDGTVWVCDWNWPVVGPAWLDTVMLLVQPRGDGLDVDGVLATRSVFAGVPRDHVDVVLALLAGYFLHQGEQPVPPTSPYLRQHQRWTGEVTWAWLSERRGWPSGGHG